MAFKTEAYEIAQELDRAGDHQLAEYIMALLSDANTFVPQINETQLSFLEKSDIGNEPLPLPDAIQQDVIGIVNAVSRNMGINKFLFQGAPGTGKTETAKQIARILSRELYMADFISIVDSKLGQTQKNIAALFKEINGFPYPERVLVIFDEIDALALDRTNANDLREMGRATSTVLKELERLDSRVVLIATTNLFEYFDKAIVRRFDSVVDFNRYDRESLIDIATILLNNFLSKYKVGGRNIKLFRKIILLLNPIPYPGELKNLIRSAIVFSDPNDERDYLRRLYKAVSGRDEYNFERLQQQGFTLREIETLTGISKSQVSRVLKE